MINVENLQKLVQATRDANPRRFDMSCYTHTCGTPACVFGNYAAREDLQDLVRICQVHGSLHGALVAPGTTLYRSYTSEATLEHFGITEDEAEELFAAPGEVDDYEEGGCGGARSPAEAVKYLEAFIARKLREEGTAS